MLYSMFIRAEIASVPEHEQSPGSVIDGMV